MATDSQPTTHGGHRDRAGRKPSPYPRRVITGHWSDEQDKQIRQAIKQILEKSKPPK